MAIQTSSRPRDVGGSFASRRGHASQLSISDSSHHITETIGTLYGDDDDYANNDARPLSWISNAYGGEQVPKQQDEPPSPEDQRLRLVRSRSDKSEVSAASAPSANGTSKKSQVGRKPSQRSDGSPSSPMSPTLQDMREEEGSSQFPLGNIDNPNDIAQELSNLQALRRMSMDVPNSHDPDLPFQNFSLMPMPSIAPQGNDDEGDPSRLLWVPAGVHPELAPTEFKNFLEKRVQSIKRRSGESTLSADGMERSNSSALRRKKSMLSRQIDNVGGRGADGYMDGADRLERDNSTYATPELSLDELVKDPSKAVQRLTLETGGEGGADDMPILPVAPGMGLRRSTRTTYRKGGSLKDRHGGGTSKSSSDRLPFSQRIVSRRAEEEFSDSSPITESPIQAPQGFGLTRVQSEPVGENYSRPTRSIRKQPSFTREPGNTSLDGAQDEYQEYSSRPAEPRRIPSGDSVRASPPVPQIVETLAKDEEPSPVQPPQARPYPERSSSQKGIVQAQIPEEPPARSSRRPAYGQSAQSAPQPQNPQPPQQQSAPKSQQNMRAQGASNQSLNDMAHHPSPLPGGGAGRTDSLTFIPTFSAEEKKSDKKSKKEKNEPESTTSKPTSWKWFKSDDKDKKKKEEESKKAKSKGSVEKVQDNVRLDVLQTSIDTVNKKGRESLLLDRDSADNKLEEERKKEGGRKSGEQKKEKDGIFSSLFGGGKKKSDRDSGSKKTHLAQRSLSPDPIPYRVLRPDVDYHWTRFPILEERAIYRMAHIKLANPRRALHSQVLLSNFMYAYLAKVQAMHPQIQVPQSPQQKRLQEEERRRREQEQQYMEQQQAQDSMDRYNFEYHRSNNQYGGEPGSQHESGDYPEDAEIYDYGHGKDDRGNNGIYRDDRRRDDEEDEMW
ncbi:uncharacterized protein BCR38DRAFT_348478 [Pseudomassariella vexata]|uniref:Protein Zds1 C-terminal domain-containing protein n=1 Tax=Pseudomassariella vexata TaxID=1141098 RepID=A0A1Y2DRJ3_9PEZI|nr:uncharacterized protein BCR38DRAFT_348478 [Pseudomassariella vexata]ORY61295.1 hypothetical protein BCR38DRAFT_348478 [Pseudomassariella vexata]